MTVAKLIDELREQGALAVCPFDRRSPDYWTTPNDKPCKMCGGEPEGPDRCTGADLRVMARAADALASAQEEIARLSGALEPFGSVADHLHAENGWSDTDEITLSYEDSDRLAIIPLSAFRRAARVLSPSDTQPPRKAELGGGE